MKIPQDLINQIQRPRYAANDPVLWHRTCEHALIQTLEAFRRFQEITQDERQAVGLTLAWSSIVGGYEARPDQ